MVIGIGGISNAGKSKLAEIIKTHYSSNSVCILCQDDFVFPKNKIPIIKDHIDWECRDSIDFDKYREELISQLGKNDIVISEGIFAFHDNNTNSIIDRKILLSLDHGTFNIRKSNDLRWGREPDWYIEHIWNNHIKYYMGIIIENILHINANEGFDIERITRFIDSNIVK
jgi:uridine kinase